MIGYAAAAAALNDGAGARSVSVAVIYFITGFVFPHVHLCIFVVVVQYRCRLPRPPLAERVEEVRSITCA